MTRPQYGKPETWPHRVRDPDAKLVEYGIQRSGLCWVVIERTTFSTFGIMTRSVAGPFWRYRTAERKADVLTETHTEQMREREWFIQAMITPASKEDR